MHARCVRTEQPAYNSFGKNHEKVRLSALEKHPGQLYEWLYFMPASEKSEEKEVS